MVTAKQCAVLSLITLLCGGAGAQPVTSPAASTTGTEAAEEIIITGDIELRERMLAAEAHAYDVFNQFNDEKRFMITCDRANATGTLLSQQNCAPEFEREARRNQAQDFYYSLRNFLDPDGIPDGSVVPQHAPAEAVIAGQLSEYRQKLKEVAETHPEFLDALIDYTKARERYEGSGRADKD